MTERMLATSGSWEDSEKRVAGDEILRILTEHREVVKQQQDQVCEGVDAVLVENCRNKSYPETFHRRVASLPDQIREVIREAATTIEKEKYKSYIDALNNRDLTAEERQSVDAYFGAGKDMSISVQSLRVTVELFAYLNQRILQELDKSVENVEQERRLIHGNALVVYELSNYVYEYVQTFRVGGSWEMSQLYKAMTKKIDVIIGDDERLREKVTALDVAETVRARKLKEIDARIKSLRVARTEWERVNSATGSINEYAAMVMRQLPTLDVVRDSAKNQLRAIAVFSITEIVRNNVEDFQELVDALADMPLVPLDPELTCRLFRLDGGPPLLNVR